MALDLRPERYGSKPLAKGAEMTGAEILSRAKPVTRTTGMQSRWRSKYQGKGYDSLASSLMKLDDGEEKEWLTSYADRVKKSEWNALVASKPSDWIQSSDMGLQAYQQDREKTSYDRQLQNWINQMAEAPLRDANPQYYQMVQQYRDDTSYKEMNDRWNEEQRRDFGYLYAQDKKKAEEFAIALNEQLNAQAKEQQRQAVQEKATGGFLKGLGETGKAIAAGMTGIGDYSQDLAEYHARGRITERGDRLTLKEYSDAVIGGVSEHLNESFGKLDKSGWAKLMEQNANYQRTGSVGDLSDLHEHVTHDDNGYGLGDLYGIGVSSATSMLSGHALGQAGSLVQFFGSAAASAVDDARSRGASDEQALAYGAALGASESLTELIPIDSLLNIGKAAELKGALWSILKQSGEEFLGEGLNSIISSIADHYIMADKSNFRLQMQEYMDNGMTEEEAKKQAWKDLLKGIVYDAVTGAASGALSGSVTLGIHRGLSRILGNAADGSDNRNDSVNNTTPVLDNATSVLDNATPVLDNATPALEKSTPGGVTGKDVASSEESSAVDDKMSATESTVTKFSGKNESSSVKVGVSKMETVQVKPDIDSFAQQFGTQANEVRRNYLEGQMEHDAEKLQEYQVGFAAAFTIGRDGGKAEALEANVPYLTRMQREIAFELGRDASAAQKAAETKAATEKAPVTKASLGQTAQLVAEDGSNGGTVTIAEIVSMDDSGMTLRLEDGRTVTDEDLDFPEGAKVYSTVMELGMDAESANAIVKASAAASIPRTAVAEGIETAYHYGRYGYGMDALLKAKEAAEIPESILQESYRAGEKRRQQSWETAQANENRTDRKADEPKRKGKVHFRGETDTLNDVQRESLRGLEWIADLTGAQIHVENMGNSEGLSRTNGLYDPADDSIHIDLRAGSDGTGTLLYTAAHEFVHRMQHNNEAAFYRLADFLVEQYGKKGISTDALVKQQMADAAKDGIELNYDEAFEEMVADAMEAMFTDTDALTKMEKLKTQDRRLWQEIKDFVIGLAEKIKAAYARLKPDSAEARYVLQMKESIDQIAQLFAEGIIDSGAEKNTVQKDGEKIRYSVRSSFAKELQEWFDTTSHDERKVSGKRFLVGTTTDVLKSIGVKDYEIYFGGSKIDRILTGNTSMTLDTIKQAVQLLEDPILIMQSRTVEDSIVLFGEVYTGGDKPVMISVLLNPKTRNGEILDYAVITSAYGRRSGNVQNLINNSTIYYVNENKNRTEKWLQALRLQLPSAITKFGSISSISGSEAEVNQKFSRRKQTEADRMQIDQQYLAAVEKGDMKTAQKMVDEAAKQWGAFLNNSETNEVFPQTGEVRTFYHGTNTGDFTVFDKGLLGNSSGDLGWFGKGFYFAFSADEARFYGGRVINAYLKMKNPYDYSQLYKFKGSDRGSSQYARFAWLYNIVKQFPDVVTDQKVYAYPNDAEEGKVVSWKQLVRWMDRIEKDAKFSVAQVELSNGDTAWELRANPKQESFTNADGETFTWTEYGMRQLFAAEMDAKEPINQIGAYLVDVMGVEPVSRRAIENIDFSGAVQKAGYDGILQSPSGDEAVVFDPSQIKLSDPVTYDDSGNIISLSKRFDNNHSDIRYSRRKQSETEALQEQNAKLREDITRLKELVKLQGKVTGGKVMKPSSVEAAAKYLKKLFHTDGDTKELAQKLNVLYEYIATDPELTWEGVKEQAAPIVQWLQDNEKFQRDQYAQDVLDTLKGQTFQLDETQLGEVNSQYGSLKTYRKAVKNMVSSKAAQSLDQLWQELSSHYPDIFPPDTSASDMPLMFADALERLEGMESTEFAMDWRMKDQAMLEAVYDSYWRVSGLETVADKYSKKIFEIRGKHYEKMTELRKDRDQKLKELRESKKQSVQTVRDNRDRADLRRKIQKHAKAMSQKLLKPSDNAHVPEELRYTVAQVLNAINMESQYTLDPETGKRKKAPDGLPVERTKAFLKLQQQCNAIMENGGNVIIDPEMADKLTDVLGWSDTPMAEMTKEQLETVWKVIRSVEHSISTAGKMLSKARWESVDGFAGALEQTAQSRGKRKQLTNRNIGLDMETPITFFSHFGEAGVEMFRILRDAQDKEQVLQDLMGAEARKLATAKQIEQLESQVHQFTVDGQTLYLNTAQIMELYVLTKQEDARSHLLSENNGKGIVQPNVEGQLDAGGKKKKVKVREGEQAVRMNAGELGTIIGSLSKEQRALADGIQKLTDLLAAEGNKASMQVYGYQKFTGKDYWPIRSSSLQLKEGVDKRLTPKRSVKNMSSAKNRQENAKNALTVPGIFDTFSRHCKEMTEYAAYLAVMEDLDRLYNYQYSEKTTNEQGEEVWKLTNKAAKGYLKQLAGTGADRYWLNLMEDLQNGIGSNSVWGYGTVGKAKAAAVSGNIRVILQQFTAFPRAAVCMKTSDLTFGIAHSKGAWKRALQHSPTAMRKDAGTFDIGNGKQMKELLFDIHSGLDKANDALAKGAGWADAVTWGWLWRAAEHQVARDYKKRKLEISTDAYWQEVNRVFTQVIDESQVIDGILQRSQYMRNPDGISKMQTAFMGEPTMALNLVLRSYDSWVYETDENKRKEAGKRLARAASGVVLANVLAAIAQSIPDAWRDDDEDKTYWERFAKALTGYDPEAEGWQQVKGIVLEGNLVSSLNPLGWVPWIKDVLSLMQGFDVSRADTDLIKDLVTAATNITNKDSTKTTAYRVKELAEVGVKLLGNGMSNILRDVYGFTHSVMVDAQNAAGLYTINALVHEPMSNKGRYMNLLYRAIGWGDTGGYDYVKQQLLSEGYTDGDIRNAMKERIKADYKEGTIDRDTAFDRLVKYASDPELDAEEAKNELWFQLEAIDGKAAYQAENGNAEGYSYSRYDKVYAAIRGNGSVQDAVKEMTDHGYERETVIGAVKSQIGKWQRDGEITETEARKMLTTYGEMAAADAKARTEAWTWMKQNPKTEATVEQVEAYLRPLEGLNRSASELGIGIETYLKEKTTVADFKSDKDEYGKSIAYSRINKAFPYINRLNLSSQQKTAMAVACGWSYKTVMENKLW